MTDRAAIETVLARLDMRGPKAAVLDGDEVARWAPAALAALRRAGWLAPAAAAQIVDCDACQEDHSGHVHWIGDESDERAYIDCPVRGRVAVDAARLVRWRPSGEAIAAWLAVQLGIRSVPRDVDDGIWRIGLVLIGGQRRSTFLALGGVDGRTADTATARLKSPLLFAAAPSIPTVRAPTVNLAEVLHIQDDRLLIDWPTLEELCSQFTFSPESDVGREPGSSGRPKGRTMGPMLDCWFTCHHLANRFDSVHAAYAAIDKYLALHPPVGLYVLSAGRFSNARSSAGRQRSESGGCNWIRCSEGPPSDLLSA